MIIVDTALQRLEAEGKPIRVGLLGAGFMGAGIVRQIAMSVPGMRIGAIANRTVSRAVSAYNQAGLHDVRVATNAPELREALARDEPVVTTDALALCAADGIDVIVEVTGTIAYATHAVVAALEAGKHVVLMNAELDATIGPILKKMATEAGVVLTASDGDQPGVLGNLIRQVRGLGVKPVMCGNIKGFHDTKRNPRTQAGFAETWDQNPYMVTSFADGSKISFEQAIVANATGMRVARRGMIGPTVPVGTPVTEVAAEYPLDAMLDGPGIVDYVVGASPAPGVFVLGTHDDPAQQKFLKLYKLGDGPLYCFYTPYHLCHFEVHNSVARAVLFQDATLEPLAGPVVDVVCAAKTDLDAGAVLDTIGGYMAYGLCENTDVASREGLLPLGLAEGCTLRRDVAQDDLLTFDDVTLPPGRLVDELWREQRRLFADG